MTSEDFYMLAITHYLPYVLFLNQPLIRTINKSEKVKT